MYGGVKEVGEVVVEGGVEKIVDEGGEWLTVRRILYFVVVSGGKGG